MCRFYGKKGYRSQMSRVWDSHHSCPFSMNVKPLKKHPIHEQASFPLRTLFHSRGCVSFLHSSCLCHVRAINRVREPQLKPLPECKHLSQCHQQAGLSLFADGCTRMRSWLPWVPLGSSLPLGPCSLPRCSFTMCPEKVLMQNS